MGGLVHLEPLRGRDLVGADDRADLVVEHLGRGARERGEALVAQPRSGTSSSGTPSVAAPCQISSALKACTCISGTASLIARTTET